MSNIVIRDIFMIIPFYLSLLHILSILAIYGFSLSDLTYTKSPTNNENTI